MRRLTLLLILFAASLAHAQGGNAVVVPFAGAPTGSCAFVMFGANTATGDLYYCNSLTSAWTLFLGSSNIFTSGVSAQTVTPYTFTQANGGKLVTFNATNFVISLLQAGSGGNFTNGWFVYAKNIGTTAATISPSVSTINGASSLVLSPQDSAFIMSDGTNYTALVNRAGISIQPGLGDGFNAIAAQTYTYDGWYNDTGTTVTITGIKCKSDNNGTTTLDVKNGAGTSLLTGVVTCTNAYAAGSQSATVTIAAADHISIVIVADGTSKFVQPVITGWR